MAFDEHLAQRLRDSLAAYVGVTEKRMMGGLCLLVNGNMVAGIDRTKSGEDRYMFRVGKENEAEALARTGAQVVEMGGRRMGGFIFVAARDCPPSALADWIALAMSHVGALPAKPSAPARSTRRSSRSASAGRR